MASFSDRLKGAWNAFVNTSHMDGFDTHKMGVSYGYNPTRVSLRTGSERSIVTTIYNQIAVDMASIDIRHVKVDENRRYTSNVNSHLNECLTLEANIDQTARSFMQDVAMSLFEEGVVAIVPVDTTVAINDAGSFDVLSMRVGQVVAWYPRHVRVRVYNDRNGQFEELTLSKEVVAIIENPLYSIMNEPNSTLQRLIRKLALLDVTDESASSTKLDMIFQLPYVIKSEARREQAEKRRKDIEDQLRGSEYGIAYTDGTERITQLNRPVESNLLPQIEFLTTQLFNQLGMSASVFNGTADEATMNNYYSRTIEPILGAVTQAFRRTFLTKTARSQGHTIKHFREPFKLVPVSELAEIADKFTRNEILSSNEFRAIMGYMPADSKRADELRNKNIPDAKQDIPPAGNETPVDELK